MSDPHRALEGRLVLDLSRLLPGPYCSMILAAHGARVIAVEDHRFAEEATPLLSSVNRNKEHISLNLKSAAGAEAFRALAQRADVILEGFRPGVVDRLGVGYEAIRKINPGIVYCSITGYGQAGHGSARVGHDINFLGYSGALSVIGEAGRAPVVPGLQIADVAGGLNAAIGILLAVIARERTGEGQYIDLSITDATFAMLSLVAGACWAGADLPVQGDCLLSQRYACYTVYPTADGKYLTVGALEPRFWVKLCERFDVQKYAELQFDEAHQREIKAFFTKAFLTKTRAQWADLLADEDLCVGEVLEIDEALASTLARDRNMVVPPAVDASAPTASPVLGVAAKLSLQPGAVRSRAPQFGENTRHVLEELGFSTQKVETLLAEGAAYARD